MFIVFCLVCTKSVLFEKGHLPKDTHDIFAGQGFPGQGLAQAQGVGGGVAVTKSTPVSVRTETVYATSTIPLFLGAKKFFTTLTQSIGMTTITDYKTETVGGFGGGGIGNAAGPGFTITSSPVIKDTVVPTTILKEIKITLRNKPLTTTLTTTTSVSTQVTSYVTKTVRTNVVPTVNPLAALGGNPLAALLG